VPVWKQGEDLRDHGRVPAAVPGVALQQSRRGVEEQREQHMVGLGEIEGALDRAPGGRYVAERVPAIASSMKA
jgi:hypothetical protein